MWIKVCWSQRHGAILSESGSISLFRVCLVASHCVEKISLDTFLDQLFVCRSANVLFMTGDSIGRYGTHFG